MRNLKSMALAFCTAFTAFSASAQAVSPEVFMTQSGKEVAIYPIKHASMRITYDGKEIEVDPVIKLAPSTDYTTYPKADIILITHEHGDHCDKQAVTDLSKNGTMIISNPNSAAILGRGAIVKNGDVRQLASDIMLEAVPAYNNTPEKMKFHPQGRDNGYILTIDGLRIYLAGDTEVIDELKNVKNIDVAFLPCNLPYTMSPEQLAEAAKIIQPKVLFPYHFSQTKIEQVSDLLKDSGIEVRIRNFQ